MAHAQAQTPFELISTVKTDHKDLIHDVALDFYGTRMATCSSDQSVKIWNLDDDGTWTNSAKWKTHAASVWKVTWAHPIFGQLIATASFDRTAAVWEEIVREAGETHWVKRATFVDSRTSVTDVKFAPKQLGLMLATASADGYVRIYENIDPSNLAQWQLQFEIYTKFPSVSCISWSDSMLHPSMLAVGCDDESQEDTDKLAIYNVDEQARKWNKVNEAGSPAIRDPIYDMAFAPAIGRSYLTIAVASKDLYLLEVREVAQKTNSSGGAPNRSISGGDLTVDDLDDEHQHNLSEKLLESMGNHPGDAVPDSGASNQQAATAAGGEASRQTSFRVEKIAKFEEHASRVWRVSWNVTGTLLASSGDDGCVRLWRSLGDSRWHFAGSFTGKQLSGGDAGPAPTGGGKQFGGAGYAAEHHPFDEDNVMSNTAEATLTREGGLTSGVRGGRNLAAQNSGGAGTRNRKKV